MGEKIDAKETKHLGLVGEVLPLGNSSRAHGKSSTVRYARQLLTRQLKRAVPPSPYLIVMVSLATRVRRTKNEGVAEGRTSQSEVGTTLVRRTNLKASVAVTWSGFLYNGENPQ
jgi:hypothetical protein